MSRADKSLLARLRKVDAPAAPNPTPPMRPTDVRPASRGELTVFIVAGEHSGDVLGGALMRELSVRRKGQIRFIGVGGEAMEAHGLTSLFPLGDIAVMGPKAILKALPRLVRRVYQTVGAGVVASPDIIIIIDSPEFTHPVARRLRRKLPHTPIINYVCPSVWAWRPGRATKMTRYVDRVLTLLPFEPAALQRLGGPIGTYIGHPLSERQAWIAGIDTHAWADRFELNRNQPALIVLPGSRRSEVEQLMPVFGETITRLHDDGYRCQLLMPCVPHLRERVEELSKDWPMPRHFIEGEEAKFAAFKIARAALAASGTVTLELGIAGTPMVVAYLVDRIAARLRFLMKVQSVVLANLVLGKNAFSELLQEDCNAEQLSAAVKVLLDDTPARAAQLKALADLSAKMRPIGKAPSVQAADVVMEYAKSQAEFEQ
jgi:lipid-A-disaccharide synthase